MKPFEHFYVELDELEQIKTMCRAAIEYYSKQIYTVEYGANPDAADKCKILTRILSWTEED